jgi:hypothetical protein
MERRAARALRAGCDNGADARDFVVTLHEMAVMADLAWKGVVFGRCAPAVTKERTHAISS